MVNAVKQEVISTLNEALRTTKNLLKLVPWDKLEYKPHEKTYTLKQLLGHMQEAELFMAKGIVKGDWGSGDEEEGKDVELGSREEVIKKFEENHKQAIKLLEGLSESDLLNKQVKTPWKMEGSALRMAFMWFEHMIHHRMQLFMYLKLLGLKVDTMTIYG